jgi:succinate-semialdehyde dehydrogenase/glutarate-semialdehyde dehydrogenase
MALEMGKPLAAGRAEIEKCIQLCHIAVEQFDHWDSLLRSQGQNLDSVRGGARYEVSWSPSGVSLGIMPWNFPFWQIFRMAVPSLLAGNSVVMKPAEPTSGTGLLLESIFQKIFPPNLFRTVLFSNDQLEKVVAHRKVSTVTFTGSTLAGSRIAEICGKHLKKCVLELGGNDPYIVAQSADLKKAAEVCARARLVNSGQSCVAAKRFYVHREVFAEFQRRLIQEVQFYSSGDPFDESTHLGPVCADKYKQNLIVQRDLLLQQGFKSVFQGLTPLRGAFVAPEVFVGEGPGLVNEEIFGPLFQVMPFDRFEEALQWCNSSRFGLGAGLFSRNERELDDFSTKIQAGFVALNDHVRSDARFPFGGVKDSGFGREMGFLGFLELINVKTILRSS